MSEKKTGCRLTYGLYSNPTSYSHSCNPLIVISESWLWLKQVNSHLFTSYHSLILKTPSLALLALHSLCKAIQKNKKIWKLLLWSNLVIKMPMSEFCGLFVICGFPLAEFSCFRFLFNKQSILLRVVRNYSYNYLYYGEEEATCVRE